MEVGRNEECPCGSGKKYKKCCLNKVVSLNSVIGTELDQLQGELFNYFDRKDSDKFFRMLDEYFPDIEMEEDEGKMFTMLLIQWFTLHQPFGGDTLVNQFIKAKKKQNQVRPSAMKQLVKWGNIPPSLSFVTKVIDDEWIEVTDYDTEDQKKVKLFEGAPVMEEGIMLFGFLLPYGSYYSYFLFALDFPVEYARDLAEDLRDDFDSSQYDTFSEYMAAEYPNVIKRILFEPDSIDIDQLEWKNPLYKKVVELYIDELDERSDDFQEVKEIGVVMWNIFTVKNEPTFRKPEVYAAALHYFIGMNVLGLGNRTQKELAELYGVSTTSLSKAYRQLEDRLGEELEKMHQILDETEDGNPPSLAP